MKARRFSLFANCSHSHSLVITRSSSEGTSGCPMAGYFVSHKRVQSVDADGKHAMNAMDAMDAMDAMNAINAINAIGAESESVNRRIR